MTDSADFGMLARTPQRTELSLIGLININIATDFTGLQLGLLNVNVNGIEFLPIPVQNGIEAHVPVPVPVPVPERNR